MGNAKLISIVGLALCLFMATADAGLSKLWSSGHQSGEDYHLTTVDQLNTLFEASKADGSTPQQTRNAINDLHQLVTAGSANICSPDKVIEIREFNEKYMNNSGDQEVPKYLRNFFIAYGLQVSAACKQNMIGVLQSVEGKYGIKQTDYNSMEKLIDQPDGEFSKILSNPKDFDDLLLPSDIIRVASKSGHGVQQVPKQSKMTVSSFASSSVAYIKVYCEKRFKPIYDQAIVPVIELSNMGFYYKSSQLALKSADYQTRRLINKWYKISFICESLASVNIFVEPKENEVGRVEENRQTIHVMTEEEAQAYKQKAESEGRQVEAMVPGKFDWMEQVVYDSTGSSVSLDKSKVLDTDDKDLMKSIDKFDETKTEVQRIQSRLTKKFAKVLWRSLKQGKINLVGTLMKRDRTTIKGDIGRELTHELDSYFGASEGTKKIRKAFEPSLMTRLKGLVLVTSIAAATLVVLTLFAFIIIAAFSLG